MAASSDSDVTIFRSSPSTGSLPTAPLRRPGHARAAKRPDRRPLGDHRARAGEAAARLQAARPRCSPRRGLCPFCEGQEDKTPPEIVAYRERGTRPNGPGLADPGRPQQVPRAEDRGEPEQAGRRHLRQDGRRRRPRGHHREPAASHQHGHAHRGQHPRGPLGLPRPPGRPEEGHAAGPRHALQERRRRRRAPASSTRTAS